LAVLAGVVGSFFGFVTNLYSSEFRDAIESSANGLDAAIFRTLLAVVVSSVSTAMAYWFVIRRRQQPSVKRGEIEIQPDALDVVSSDQDAVVGRSLKYLEAKRSSDELLIFMSGLGLDAGDFQLYMAESKLHCIALTLYGFNVEERSDDRYEPISLESHVELVLYALQKIREKNNGKRITLVGFSYGADILLFLAQFAARQMKNLRIDKVLLLDPNVSRSTMTISSRVAQVQLDQPLEQLHKVLESAASVEEFRNLCEYLYKITAKNFAQVLRQAHDVVAMWPDDTHDVFLDRLGKLMAVTADVRVVVSFNYQAIFNRVARGVTSRGLNIGLLECAQNDHFDLIGTTFLKNRLEGMT